MSLVGMEPPIKSLRFANPIDQAMSFWDTSAGTGKLCILGHLGLVFIWSCFVSCLLFLLFYVSLRNLCSGTCRKNLILEVVFLQMSRNRCSVFDPFRTHFRFSGKGTHGYSWRVAVILATVLIRRSSYTISPSCHRHSSCELLTARTWRQF